jgi:CheY-like chemotaxis protein
MDTCFIAMPISTPTGLVERYENDSDHFLHVLEHLFVPAIENVGLKPISPLTAGSSVIHAEIIKQITDAQLVLCDMSTLNANVFFELGVRTALDRAVCLVVDHITGASPFDLSLVNHHKYNPALAPWVLKDEIPRLQKHVEATLAGGEHNAMWSIVSLTRTAEVRTDPGDPAAARLELLENQVRLLANSLSGGNSGQRRDRSSRLGTLQDKMILWVDDIPENNSLEVKNLETRGASVIVAKSTKEATEVLQRHEFDLILSDIHRAEGGISHDTAGFELLSTLREDLKIYTPLIFYTSNANKAAQASVVRKYRAPVADSPSDLLNLVIRELAEQ